MTGIKICGLTDPATAVFAAGLGAEYLGMVFAPSYRRISANRASQIAEALDHLEQRPQLVGVFVHELASEVNRLAGEIPLDIVQLSGDEDEDYMKQIKTPIIRCVPIGSSTRDINTLMKNVPGSGITLLDCRQDSQYGGTGKRFDWDILTNIDPGSRIMVAGGLTPENVAELIRHHHPWGVDVSSGVETGGIKDLGKIKAFVAAVRAASEEGGYDVAR